MSSAFDNDDYYNVIAEHALKAIAADSVLGTSGSMAFKIREQEFRGLASFYNENELPAVASACDLSEQIPVTTSVDTKMFGLNLYVITGGGRLQNVLKSVKDYAARTERVILQQDHSNKQLDTVTTDLLNAQSGSVRVSHAGSAIGGDAVGESETYRGVAVLSFAIEIDFEIVSD